jgi:hypothetical protein
MLIGKLNIMPLMSRSDIVRISVLTDTENYQMSLLNKGVIMFSGVCYGASGRYKLMYKLYEHIEYVSISISLGNLSRSTGTMYWQFILLTKFNKIVLICCICFSWVNKNLKAWSHNLWHQVEAGDENYQMSLLNKGSLKTLSQALLLCKY